MFGAVLVLGTAPLAQIFVLTTWAHPFPHFSLRLVLATLTTQL